MPMPMQDIETEALRLPPAERGQLAERLLQSLEPEAEDTPEDIAMAWDKEIVRRIDELEAGQTEAIPYEQVRAELRALIWAHRPQWRIRAASRGIGIDEAEFSPGGE